MELKEADQLTSQKSSQRGAEESVQKSCEFSQGLDIKGGYVVTRVSCSSSIPSL